MNTNQPTTAIPTQFQSTPDMEQKYSLLWVDQNIVESNIDWQQNLTQVELIIKDVNVFTKPNECIKFLKTISMKEVLIIMSGSVGRDLVTHIHDLS